MSRTQVPAVDKTAGKSSQAIDVMTAPKALDRFEVSPKSLLLEPNVRTSTDLNKAFLRSIKEHGVIVPVLVKVSPTGGYSVVDGQRRTLAAVQMDLPLVPVTLIDSITNDGDLISTQIVVNDERAQVSSWETAQGIKQLALMGISATQIVKRTGKKKEVVQAAIEVAKEPANAALFESRPYLDLVTASKIAEFADHKDLQEELQEVAQDPGFDHALAQAEKTREVRATIAAETAKFADLGYLILESLPAYDDTEIKSLTDLSSSASGGSLTDTEHMDCPGKAVRVATAWNGEISQRFYCTKWKTAGHFNRYANSSAGATAGPQGEEQKAQRRHVVDMNKLADAALEVHQAWLTEFFQRPAKSQPKNLMAQCLTIYGAARSRGVDPSIGDGADFVTNQVTPEMSEQAATWVFAAMVCGAVQRKMTKDFWRDQWQKDRAVPLLVAMVSWGYEPAPFELDLIAGTDLTEPTVSES